MPDIKGTVFFRQLNEAWTESFVFESAGPGLDAPLAKVRAYAGARIVLCGKETEIYALRVSDEASRGDSLIGRLILKNNTVDESEDPETCLSVFWKDLTRRRKKTVFMRGLQSRWFIAGGVFDVNQAVFRQNFQFYSDTIKQLGLGWLGRINTVASPITNAQADVNLVWTITTVGPIFELADVGTQQLVGVAGFNGKSPVNGNWVALVTGQSTFKISQPIGAGPWRAGGKARLIKRELIAVDVAEANRIGTRKAGSPLLVTPGRRRNRPKV